MSKVTGAVLIISICEEEEDDLLLEEINQWMDDHEYRAHWNELTEHFGGNKHPQLRAYGAGINHFDEEEFAKAILTRPWDYPENVVLVLQPEEGPTQVFRPWTDEDEHTSTPAASAQRNGVLVVTGGRDYDNEKQVHRALDILNPAEVNEGGCPTGADKSTRSWRESNHVDGRTFYAAWSRLGRRAGPVRNHMMLVEAQPDLVLAFPGGAGTQDCVRRAKQLNIPVIHFDESTDESVLRWPFQKP